ncbi:ROK family protein [Streptococcus jiangjianxini]|uniref:ROK family protein n=1 Tax=Streptococcus jiangjianxini TaxID=3161189 RepID=UPI0032EB94A9
MILGIDIGGTSIKSDVYNHSGQAQNLFKEIDTPVNLTLKTNDIRKALVTLINDYLAMGVNLDGVAISSAGVIDATLGEVIYAGPTIPQYTGTALKALVESTFDLPCSVENDVNCAALGEAWLGAARDSSSSLCLTIGTGVGGAVILNGQVWRGFSQTAGEVGYLPLADKTLQDYASTTSLVQSYCQLKQLKRASGKTIFKAYDEGDEVAYQVVQSFCAYLAQGLLPMIYTLNPERIILGGGIFQRSEILLPSIEAQLKSRLQSEQFYPDQVSAAKLGNEAGRIGAVYWFLQQHGQME